jgi:hypothetical protein
MAQSLLASIMVLAPAIPAFAQEYLTGVEWQKPPVVTPGKSCGYPPSDAIILFDGKDLSKWNGAETWKVADGYATVGSNDIETKQHFGDSQLHIEWSAPTPATGHSQGRGNSGVFFGYYELQVLDSYQDETYYDGQAASIYKQHPPQVNAMRPPGEWNVYDVIWTAPKFTAEGKLESPAYITVLHNGVLVQNHFKLLGDTPYNRPPQYNPPSELPVRLQNHGNPVKYRNIWIRPLKEPQGKKTREPFFRDGDKETPVTATKITGQITFNGEKLASGKVHLSSEDGRTHFAAEVHGGQFTIDSVKPGEYAVTVSSKVAGQAEVPAKYGDPATSGIKVAVASGENSVKFDLVEK